MMAIGATAYGFIFAVLKHHIPTNVKNNFKKLNIEIFEQTSVAVVVMAIICCVYTLYTSIYPKMSEMMKMFAYLFVMFYIGNCLYYYAYNNLPTDTYAVVENVEVIASLIIGYFLLNEKITIHKIVGACLIIGGIAYGVLGSHENHYDIKDRLKQQQA